MSSLVHYEEMACIFGSDKMKVEPQRGKRRVEGGNNQLTLSYSESRHGTPGLPFGMIQKKRRFPERGIDHLSLEHNLGTPERGEQRMLARKKRIERKYNDNLRANGGLRTPTTAEIRLAVVKQKPDHPCARDQIRVVNKVLSTEIQPLNQKNTHAFPQRYIDHVNDLHKPPTRRTPKPVSKVLKSYIALTDEHTQPNPRNRVLKKVMGHPGDNLHGPCRVDSNMSTPVMKRPYKESSIRPQSNLLNDILRKPKYPEKRSRHRPSTHVTHHSQSHQNLHQHRHTRSGARSSQHKHRHQHHRSNEVKVTDSTHKGMSKARPMYTPSTAHAHQRRHYSQQKRQQQQQQQQQRERQHQYSSGSRLHTRASTGRLDTGLSERVQTGMSVMSGASRRLYTGQTNTYTPDRRQQRTGNSSRGSLYTASSYYQDLDDNYKSSQMYHPHVHLPSFASKGDKDPGCRSRNTRKSVDNLQQKLKHNRDAQRFRVFGGVMENVAPVSKQEKQSMGMVGGGKRTHQPRYQTRVAGIIDQNQAQKEVAAARHDRGSKVQSLSRNKAIQEFGSTVFAPPKPVVTRESRKNKHERLW